MEYNVYCDESCHLEHDNSNSMSLGGIYYPTKFSNSISDDIVKIKNRYGIKPSLELKWTKASERTLPLYKELLRYFFTSPEMEFRGLLVPDKDKLDHKRFVQTHDEWYYKMYFEMLRYIFKSHSNDTFNVYLDIKDTNSAVRMKKLRQVLSNENHDFKMKQIAKIQPIRSDEVQTMQLVDIITGALARSQRTTGIPTQQSEAKLAIIKEIRDLSGSDLHNSTTYAEKKFNLFAWRAS